MTKRMLIDATQPEETRVVLTSGNRVEDFDFEVANRRQLKGNIYLARVTRVEPSLQAAFVEYGGNRHGFLAFNEIHPDYYRIPMEDREALLAEQAHEARDMDEDLDDLDDLDDSRDEPEDDAEDDAENDAENGVKNNTDDAVDETASDDAADQTVANDDGDTEQDAEIVAEDAAKSVAGATDDDTGSTDDPERRPSRRNAAASRGKSRSERPSRRASHRRYKIQEVVTRRQIMLVQVVKEERGNKGAALTTFLSLAGRYCVLMPNTPRGGGVSRKITNAVDRKRLKQVVEGLEVPEGMAVIVRTAGSQRTKTEIKRDYEYLLRLWDQIREATLVSTAPCLVHEEANLIKRSIRDLYARDIDEVLVEGEEGYRIAKSFMKTLMPSHARRVQRFAAGGVPMFSRFQVEGQLDAIHSSTVQLRSGGYVVMNQTEALVAIDVNSGRSTRERNIEETALKTNLEAAEEVARQLRLRDLAGLIVIDFIDMDESRNQHAVERKMKDVVKNDRARIQLGRISQFGLMELSRQRLRPSVAEASTQPCPHCEGTGRVRSIDSAALQVLRNIEEEGLKQRASEIAVHLPTAIGFYVLNRKRDVLAGMEERYAFQVTLEPDDTLIAPEHRIDRLVARTGSERTAVLDAIGAAAQVIVDENDADLPEDEDQPEDVQEVAREDRQEERRPRRRRRRSDRGRSETETGAPMAADGEQPDITEARSEVDQDPSGPASASAAVSDEGDDDDGAKRRRRRGKRGGRRRSRRPNGDDAVAAVDGETPVAAGPESGDVTQPEPTAEPDAEEAASAAPDTPDADGPAAEGSEQPAAATTEATAPDAEPEAPAPRKRAPRTRRPRRRSAAESVAAEPATAPEAPAVEVVSEDPETQSVPEPVPEPAPEPAVASSAAPAEPVTPTTEPTPPADIAAAAQATIEPVPEASTTTQAVITPEVEDMAGVNGAVSVNGAEQSGSPRRGWWNRLLP